MAKSVGDLAIELKKMYDGGEAKREQVVQIILFGVKFADDLQRKGVPKEVVKKAFCGKHSTYNTEVRRGMKLAKYVDLKAD